MEEQNKEPKSPLSDHDWTVHSLNIHGIFFERWCKHIVDNSPQWHVKSTQYPVGFSPVAGPLHKVGGHESALDIHAVLSYHDGRLLNLLVECKKNNPEFIEWMFFPIADPSDREHLVIPAVSCPSSNKDMEHHILRPMLKDLYLGVSVADESRETRGDYQSARKDKKTKTANDSIYSAAHQVALATQAIFLEEASNNLPEKPIKGAKKWRAEKQLFIPAIVTTARLYLCEFDPADVSPAEGVIPFDKVSLIEKPYLIYKYPLPVHLQMDRGHILYLSSEKKLESLVRMHIFVVNSAHFPDFLTFLRTKFSQLFWDMDIAD